MDRLEIDHIEYDIRKKLGWIDFFVYLKVNDVLIKQVLDVSELTKAIESSGDYPLFTCECGDIKCNGFCVDIECNDDYLTMKNRYLPLAVQELVKIDGIIRYYNLLGHTKGDLIEEVAYQFPWSQILEVAMRIDEMLRKAISEAPPHVYTPDAMLSDLGAAIKSLNNRLHASSNG